MASGRCDLCSVWIGRFSGDSHTKTRCENCEHAYQAGVEAAACACDEKAVTWLDELDQLGARILARLIRGLK